MRRLLGTVALLTFGLLWTACGGGGSGGSSPKPPPPLSGANVLPISVNDHAFGFAEIPYVTVTVCSPITSACQQIPNVLVDTGSFGLRIFSQALQTPLAQQTDGANNLIAECFPFVSDNTWGPIQYANVKLGGEPAVTMPIQVINAGFSTVPASCTNSNVVLRTPPQAGFNGILGVGTSAVDCGAGCAQIAATNVYFSCTAAGPSGVCSPVTQPIESQVVNPAVVLPADNNGVFIRLPSIGTNGAQQASGSLVFGIGTEANNGLRNAHVFRIDPVTGNFTVQFNGQTLSESFIDSGSNGLFFPDSSIPQCSADAGFYCPPQTLNFQATNEGLNGETGIVKFNIANFHNLLATGHAAFNDIGGAEVGGGIFDWGLPFFFGRSVYFAINGAHTPGGPGPYYAY
ncbi:MAG: DUF3443 domain-containing protein [Candidatus Binataceae bacterium]